MEVRNAVNKLTPPSENNTTNYLAELKKAGIDLDKDVLSQIDVLMKAIEANEGMIEGIEVKRDL